MPKKSQKNGRKQQKEKSGDQTKETPKRPNKGDGPNLLKGGLKMTLSSIPSRQHREKRAGRLPGGKRVSLKEMPGKLRTAYRRSLDPCDNSNDSGLGFDHHVDIRHHMGIADRLGWPDSDPKRARLDIKVENDEDNDGYSFPETIRVSKDNSISIQTSPSGSIPSSGMSSNQLSPSDRTVPVCANIGLRQSATSPVSLSTQLMSSSRFSGASLSIIKQPEQQHRARYQTEGSRGAVKDREGNGFPIVQLNGYYKSASLQIFIGTDVGRVSPHMFYQACKVSGKNSTPCNEKKIEGTCVIELQLDPAKDMSAICDCVGILKERNVDVEHRFPDQLGNRSKKKSTRCRMIFRTTILHDDGRQETLQICSQPIVCTQPPGVPEISKKSLTSCPAAGGLELFVLGKNFSKDTKVYFQQVDEERLVSWEHACVPDKEFLQQTHLVCVVPPYQRPGITEPVSVRLFVVASGKASESHQFVYTPVNGAVPSVTPEVAPQQSQFFNKMLWPASLSKRDQDLNIMPPPETSMVPLCTRRPSLSFSQSTEVLSPPLHTLKQEYIDENSQSSIVDSNELHQERYRHISESSLDVHHGDSNVSMINDNSMDIIHQNVSSSDILHHDNSSMSMNENSVQMMVRRNSMSRSLTKRRESSLDLSSTNSNMTILNEDSSCSTVMHCAATNDQLLINSSSVHPHNVVSPTSHNTTEVDELKVMDLRMKMPMATVADLASTGAPSLATLQNLGVTEASIGPLPTQTAQSIESFLTNMECKTSTTNSLMENFNFKDRMTSSILNNSTQNSSSGNSNDHLRRLTEPLFINSQQPFVIESSSANTSVGVMSKTESMEMRNKTPDLLPTTLGTSFNSDRFDVYLNPTSTHMIITNSRSEPMKDNLNTRPSMMTSPVLNPQISSPTETNVGHAAHNISPDIILNSQVSPSMMCQVANNTLPQESILSSTNICSTGIESNLIPRTLSPQRILLQPNTTQASSNSMPAQLTLGEQEKAVLLEAAADLLQTQKKLSELECLSPENKEPIMNNMYMNNFLTITNDSTNTSIMAASPTDRIHNTTNDGFNTATPTCNVKPDFIIPISVKEMQITTSSTVVTAEKKIEDRMIPQGFTTLTENELINFINPSCFDQV